MVARGSGGLHENGLAEGDCVLKRAQVVALLQRDHLERRINMHDEPIQHVVNMHNEWQVVAPP